jgi:hypothetical protein
MKKTTIEERIKWRMKNLDENHEVDSWEFNKNGIISVLKDMLDPEGWTASKMQDE